ncbi:MAG: DUF2953 domain-containing protein [Lachnospiraceae bacterium]|nr:DUF2953 domain-containing protein [Lachnospiraceae bacterium]
MVHILLIILKIIGILLAVIVTLALMILFIPFIYDGSIEAKGKEVRGVFDIRWIARIILFRIYNKEGDILYVLKIFGIPFLKGSITDDDDSDEKNAKKRNKKKGKALKEDDEELVEEDEDVFESLLKVLQDDTPIHQSGNSQHSNQNNAEKSESRFDKVKEKIKNVIYLIKDIPEKYRKVKEIFEVYKNKAKRLKKILKSKRFKVAFAYSKDILIKVYNHIKPSKLEADIVFGFEEPDVTGKALAVLAVACGTVKIDSQKFRVVPDFTEKRFEGKGIIYGKFLLAVILINAIKIYFKKEVRDVVNGIKRV